MQQFYYSYISINLSMSYAINSRKLFAIVLNAYASPYIALFAWYHFLFLSSVSSNWITFVIFPFLGGNARNAFAFFANSFRGSAHNFLTFMTSDSQFFFVLLKFTFKSRSKQSTLRLSVSSGLGIGHKDILIKVFIGSPLYFN